MANNKHEAPLILTVHKPSRYRDHLLPTAFEEEEDLTNENLYWQGYTGGKCQVKKPGGMVYFWEEMAFAMRSAEQRETYCRIGADGQALQESE